MSRYVFSTVTLTLFLCLGFSFVGEQTVLAKSNETVSASSGQKSNQHAAKNIHPKKVVSVGKDVITDFDILTRCRLLAFLSHMPCNDEFINEVRDQIKQKLVDEAIYEQMAEQFKIVPETANIRAMFEEYAQSMELTLDAFESKLRELGCYDSCLALIRSNIIASYIYTSSVPKDLLRFSEKQIQKKIKELEVGQKEKQFEVLEIVCYSDGRGDAVSKIKKVREKLEAMCKEMPPVRAFQELVDLYSQGPSSKRNGYVGWVSFDQLDKNSRSAIAKMEIGSYSAIVQTHRKECRLYYLNDIKNPGFVSLRQSTVRVAVVTIPYSSQTSKDEEGIIKRRIPTLLSCTSPEELNNVAKDFGYKFEYIDTTLGRVEFIRGTPKNKCLHPIFTGNAFVIYMLVHQSTPKSIETITKEDALRQLEHQRKSEQTEKITKDFKHHVAIHDYERSSIKASRSY